MNLHRRRIVVTRAAHQNELLVARLQEAGAIPIVLPCIAIAPPADIERMRTAAAMASTYDWIIFSSQNAVEQFGALKPIDMPPIAAVGTATKAAAERFGWHVGVVPPTYTAEALAAVLPSDLPGKRVLIPSSAITRDVVAPALRERGAQVDVVEAYRNVAPAALAEGAARLFKPPYPDATLFASPSAVHNLANCVQRELLSRSRLASIGPATSAALREQALPVHVEATQHTSEGLIEALEQCED